MCACLVISDSCDPLDCSLPGSSVHSPGKNTGVGCHIHSLGNLPDTGIEPESPGSPPLYADSLPTEPPGKPPVYPGSNQTEAVSMCTELSGDNAALLDVWFGDFTCVSSWRRSICCFQCSI